MNIRTRYLPSVLGWSMALLAATAVSIAVPARGVSVEELGHAVELGWVLQLGQVEDQLRPQGERRQVFAGEGINRRRQVQVPPFGDRVPAPAVAYPRRCSRAMMRRWTSDAPS